MQASCHHWTSGSGNSRRCLIFGEWGQWGRLVVVEGWGTMGSENTGGSGEGEGEASCSLVMESVGGAVARIVNSFRLKPWLTGLEL